MNLWYLLGSDFMQRALAAALLTGLAAPTIGVFLLQRRQALMGDGIGHVAVTGVALGLVTNTSPTWTAVGVAILGAVIIEIVRERGRTNGDVALALLFYGGLAAGVMITGLAGQGAARLQEFLFGSLLTVSPADVWVTLVLTVVILTVTLGLLPQLFAVSTDPDFAKVAGLRVRLLNLVIAVLAAITVTLAMRTVGLLLVSALMVIPVAASQQLAASFRGTMLGGMAVGTASGVGGLLISAGLSDTTSIQPGPTIVLVALVFFVGTWPVGAIIRRRRRLAVPFPEVTAMPHAETGDHPHVHGEKCGHPAVPHGDHMDYLHDGHRHAEHGEHYDEH